MFRQVDIPTGRYSDRSLFRQVDIPTGRFSDRSIFRQLDIPTGRYSDRSIFRQVNIPTGRYSNRSIFQQVLEVMRIDFFILYLHSDFTLTKITRDSNDRGLYYIPTA